jgi:hypothetical protein
LDKIKDGQLIVQIIKQCNLKGYNPYILDPLGLKYLNFEVLMVIRKSFDSFIRKSIKNSAKKISLKITNFCSSSRKAIILTADIRYEYFED